VGAVDVSLGARSPTLLAECVLACNGKVR